MNNAAVAIALVLAGLWVMVRRLQPLVQQMSSQMKGPVGPAAGVRPWSFPSVSLIVPARNEAHNLPQLLASLKAMSRPPEEIIVVDDHSTDGTGDLARAAGALVVTPPPLPAGWLGKPWACRAGAAVARGDLLLFTDADTVHGPDSLIHVVASMIRHEADLVSVIPTHIIHSWWERLQGVFQTLLLVATRAGARMAGPAGAADERTYCIGQYLLFKRGPYEALGGHTAVRDRVAEDLAFCALIRRRGGRYALVAWPALLSVRMYPLGLTSFIAGWRRNFREGLGAAGPAGVAETFVVMAWLLGLPLWLGAAIVRGDWPAAGVCGVAYVATSLLLAHYQRFLGRFSRVSAFAYPLFAGIFLLVSGLAVFDRVRRAPVIWKGRAFPSQGSA